MKQLGQEAFNRARTFVMEQGRVLDQRLFALHFEVGTKEAVLAALADYQNGDGGLAGGSSRI
tara:strand:- start:464 stop:649 length:186 start_codon:yes stop_codon:yes gene_type:complete